MARRGQSASYLRHLRRRYGLGEFARKGRKGGTTRPRPRKGSKARKGRFQGRRKAKASQQMGI